MSVSDSTVLNVPLCYSIISSLVGVSVGQYCIECSIIQYSIISSLVGVSVGQYCIECSIMVQYNQ